MIKNVTLRQDRMWQDSLTHGVIFSGDSIICQRYYGWAIQRLGFMLKMHPGSLTSTFMPGPDVLVRICIRPNHILISATNPIFYMESGFLNLGSTAKCVGSTFLPATLNFTAPITSYLSTSTTPLEGEASINEANTQPDTPFFGEVLVNGQQSKTLVNVLGSSVTDLCGITYTSNDIIYGRQDTWLRKVTQRYVPSSLYSGKLRLFVQAIYGSKRTDYSIPLYGSGLPSSSDYNLIIDTYKLNHDLPTSGLFTTANYDYYLIECGVTSITFKKLKLTSTASDWVRSLITHPNKSDREFSSKIEAYILSTATIDSNFTPVVSTTDVIASGSPMGYGFKFNWRGNQAKIILHEDNLDGTSTSRTVTLDINDDLTVSGSVSTDKLWSNGTLFQFWSPNWSGFQLDSFGDVVGYVTNTTDCPMYGYYDYDGVWQEFTLNADVSTQTRNDAYPSLSSANFPGYGEDAPSGVDIDLISCTSKVVGTVGYTFSTDNHIFDYSSGISKERYAGGMVTNTGDPSVSVGATYTPPSGSYTLGPTTRQYGDIIGYFLSTDPRGPGDWGWYDAHPNEGSGFRYKLAWTSPAPVGTQQVDSVRTGSFGGRLSWPGYVSYTTLNEIPEIMMGVPLNDSESIFYGHCNKKTWKNKTTASAVSETNLNAVLAAKIKSTTNGTSLTGVVVSNEIVDVKQSIFQLQSGKSLSNIVSTGSGGDSDTIIKYHCSGLEGFTNQTTDGVVIREETNSVGSLPDWSEKYFRNADISGDYHPNMLIRSAANGASIAYHDENTGVNENGFPDGVYSSVGWA